MGPQHDEDRTSGATIFVLTVVSLTAIGATLLALAGFARFDWLAQFGGAFFTTGLLGLTWQFTMDRWQRRAMLGAMREVLDEAGRAVGLLTVTTRIEGQQLKDALGAARAVDAVCLFDNRWTDDWQGSLVGFLQRDGVARFLLPDPADLPLMVVLAERHGMRNPEEFRGNVLKLHRSLVRLRADHPGRVHVRLMAAPGPANTVYLLEGREADLWGVLRPYEHSMREGADLAEFRFAQNGSLYAKYRASFTSAWERSEPDAPVARKLDDGIFVLVSGPGDATGDLLDVARLVGRQLRCTDDLTVLTGGLHGVMEAVLEGVRSGSGSRPTCVGVLPGANIELANDQVDVVIATGLGQGRDAWLVEAADAVIAVGCNEGTLAEVGLARRRDLTVSSLGFHPAPVSINGRLLAEEAQTVEEAVTMALHAARLRRDRALAREAPLTREQRRVAAETSHRRRSGNVGPGGHNPVQIA